MSKKQGPKLPPELRQLERSVGQFMEYWGFKKIHGRIWAHLFTASHPLDSQELIDRLQVSKGLISLAVRELIEHDVIQASHTGKHGTVYYRANQDLMGVITKVLRTRESVMLGEARMAAESLGRLKPAELEQYTLSVENIQTVANLVTSAQSILSVFLFSEGSEEGLIFDPVNVKANQ